MRTYREVFKDKGIIKGLQSVDKNKFNEIFGQGYDVDLADDYINFIYGDRYVTDNVEIIINDNINQFYRLIWLKSYTLWKHILIDLEYSLYKTYETTKENSKLNENKSSSNTVENTVNKVYAYNSEQASNDTMGDVTNDTTQENNSTETNKETASGFNYGISLFDAIKKYKDTQIENNFIDFVASDIINFTCYDIY